ncbi:rhodanese-like domain-containing protein [Melioribacteraceae bacterium 4301-Me]|uniref:rhodanese-like domain-containing protein n=1 Tax=Pyranulibacter aquaticus TaxID=3163344 RepID=UPI003594E5B3
MKLVNVDKKKFFLIILVSVITGLIYNWLSPDGLSLIRIQNSLRSLSNANADLNSLINSNKNFILKISLKQAYKIYQDSICLFIDARDRWEYAKGHIPNAVNIAEYKFEPSMPLIKSLNKNVCYVIYCGGNDCEVSLRLATEMSKIGFAKLFVFEGGWNDWLKANYPIESEE